MILPISMELYLWLIGTQPGTGKPGVWLSAGAEIGVCRIFLGDAWVTKKAAESFSKTYLKLSEA
jgi:hypothetical protein